MDNILEVKNFYAGFAKTRVVNNINLNFLDKSIHSIIGPSGCGKSTFLRSLNRIHEEVPTAFAEGEVLLEKVNIFSDKMDLVTLRLKIGMVFQRPNPFPGMSIFENVALGPKLLGKASKAETLSIVEMSLKKAALWDEVCNKLHTPATGLSGGQQQRLCIARAIALRPKVLLMDEPTSALDPIATDKIEELMQELKKDFCVILVTHNMGQSARVADYTSFFMGGELVETGPTEEIFTNPTNKKTENYVMRRFKE
ncbi:MAG: phosphate ABC transporter ATP-binding protein PstB [Bacteriovoracaceae bacterium]